MTEQDNVQLVQEFHAAFGESKDTDRSYDNEWAMVWTLRDGKVAGWQIYEGTARELAAHAGSQAAVGISPSPEEPR